MQSVSAVTRALRRDARTKNASVITGLRLEPETATQLCDRAIEDARDEKTGRGNVSELARYFIRVGMGLSPEDANRRETHGAFSACLAGLKMEPDLCARLTSVARRLGLSKAGAARHYIRLGLGFSSDNSMAREAHFAELAAAKHEAGLGMSSQFRGTR
jgi:hypothetical protein